MRLSSRANENKVYTKVIDGWITYWREGDNCRLLSASDETANEMFDYDRRCPSCWLGYGHSGDYHRHALLRFAGWNVGETESVDSIVANLNTILKGKESIGGTGKDEGRNKEGFTLKGDENERVSETGG